MFKKLKYSKWIILLAEFVFRYTRVGYKIGPGSVRILTSIAYALCSNFGSSFHSAVLNK